MYVGKKNARKVGSEAQYTSREEPDANCASNGSMTRRRGERAGLTITDDSMVTKAYSHDTRGVRRIEGLVILTLTGSVSSRRECGST